MRNWHGQKFGSKKAKRKAEFLKRKETRKDLREQRQRSFLDNFYSSILFIRNGAYYL